MTAVPKASVVIPVRDAAEDLRRCLESVRASEGPAFEIIVVDDASGDDSIAVAIALGCRVIRVRNNIGAASCRNLGAEHARGDILVFFDADETMPPDTLARYVQELGDHPDVDAVVGSLTADTPAPGFLSRFKNFQHHHTHQTAQTEGTTLDSGRMAIRRGALLELGGFEPSFAGASIEDIALGYRMTRAGRRIRFQPGIQVTHHKRYDLYGLLRSDICDRAIPWTGLMLRERIFRNDLNTRSGNVASVALAWLAALALVAALGGVPVAPAIGLLALVAIPLLNLDFLRAARRALGLDFALRSAAFLPFMYLYQGAGLIAGVLVYLAGRGVAGRREAPAADYELVASSD